MVKGLTENSPACVCGATVRIAMFAQECGQVLKLPHSGDA